MKELFNSRCQQKGETIEEFIANLYTLVEHCEFGALNNEMICDTVVVGDVDLELS